MNQIKEKLIKFEIDNKEKLIDYFLTYYEYSFVIPYFKENKVKPKDLFLGFMNTLNNVEDLERLWYGLELKYSLFLIEEYPLLFIKNSINKTLKDINSLDIEVLKTIADTTNKILLEENIKCLIARPTILIESEEEPLFYPMKDVVEDLYNFIDKYRKYLSVAKINKCRVLPTKITELYVNADMVIVELWALLVHGYYVEKFLPMIKEQVNKQITLNDKDEDMEEELEFDEDDLFSTLEELNSNDKFNLNKEELTGEELSKVDALFEDVFNEDNEVCEEDTEHIYVDINIDKDEVFKLTSTIIQSIFKNIKFKEETLINIFEELITINITALSKILANNIDTI